MISLLKKYILPPTLVFLVFIAVGAIYIGVRLANPENVKHIVENQLQHLLNQQVSIETARFSMRKGLHVEVGDIQLNHGDNLLLKADHVTAVFSIWQLIIGNWQIENLLLHSPSLRLRLEGLTQHDEKPPALSLPPIELQNGRMTLEYKHSQFSLAQINGHILEKAIHLDGMSMGAHINLRMQHSNKTWYADLRMEGIDLGRLTRQLQGTASMNLHIVADADRIRLRANMNAHDAVLPGGGAALETLNCVLETTATETKTKITRLDISTPFSSFSGTAALDSGISQKNLATANLTLNMSANPFDFEAAIPYLPFDTFPDWLRILLKRQIRGGRVHLKDIRYNGPLADFNAEGDFLSNLVITGDIRHTSFGAGHGRNQDRITDIMATITTKNGHLYCNNISGHSGSSRLKKVNLYFPGLLEPGDRVAVDVHLDMALVDFEKTWRAGMWPEDVYPLIDPLTRIVNGRINANVTYRYGIEERSPEIKGTVAFSNCSFTWDNRKFDKINAFCEVESFGAPLKISAHGSLNGFPVKQLNLDIRDFFGAAPYNFSLSAKQLPDSASFAFAAGADIKLSGAGKDNSVSGTAQFTTSEFKLRGHVYRPPSGVITGKGRFSAVLWPFFDFRVKGMDITTAEKKLSLTSHFSKNENNVQVKGRLETYQVVDDKLESSRPLKGDIDMSLSWDAASTLRGWFDFNGFTLSHNATPIVLNGPLSLENNILSSESLTVLRNGILLKMCGILKKGPPDRFDGRIEVQGLVLSQSVKKPSIPPEIRGTITGRADIIFKDLTVYGIEFNTGSGILDLTPKVMRITDVDLTGRHGSIKGDIKLSNNKTEDMNLTLDLRSDGVKNLLHALGRPKDLIEGDLHLTGEISGAPSKLNGDLSFSASQGYTMKSSLLTKIFNALNFYKIIKSKSFDWRNDRFAFNSVSISTQIKDNIATFKDFLLDSDSIQLSAAGSFNFTNKEIDAVVGVQPLETLDWAISAIPVIGWVLTGDEGRLIVVTLKLTGPIDNPAIKVAPMDTLSAPMSETLLRILRLPSKLMETPENIMSETQSK